MGTLGVITGLASEAACLGGLVDPARCRVRCAAAHGGRAAALSRELAREGCSAFLSFGVAAGGDPGLPSGHIVLAERVIAGDTVYVADDAWLARAHTALAGELPVTVGALAGVDAPVLSGDEKRRLCAGVGAVGLDMESHAVAVVAKELGLPFLAIRAIADTPSVAVPEWLPAVIDERGVADVLAFLRGAAAHPVDWADVVRLARANRRAMASLGRAAALLGPGLGLL